MTYTVQTVLNFYVQHFLNDGMDTPPFIYVAHKTGLAQATVRRAVQKLQEAGFVIVFGRNQVEVTPRGYEVYYKLQRRCA
jgi:DNA-binding IclR family transcriptional regulator